MMSAMNDMPITFDRTLKNSKVILAISFFGVSCFSVARISAVMPKKKYN